MKKIIFVYRTKRKQVLEDWKKGRSPDSLLFGFNHLQKMGYDVDFFDDAYSPFNLYHPLFYPFEHAIINKVGMGFKLDQAMYLLPRIKNYDVIIGTGDSAGLPLLALKYFGLIKKPIIFMTSGLAGALKGKANTWVGKFYKKILPLADVFTSYAQVEIDFFEKEMGITKGKIKYMPLATDYQYFSKPSKVSREIIRRKAPLICAVGTELGRDYKTLFEAVKNLPIQVEVVCHPDNIKGLTVPSNVKIHLNIPVQEVLKIYQRSKLTIIPCYERHRSSGQMVLLETASQGLPIIASKIQGITSAFEFEDKKHLLYARPQDARDLRQKIIFLLENPGFASRLGKQASDKVRNHYTTYHLAKRLASFVESL